MQAKPSQERSRAVFKPPKTAEGGDFGGQKQKKSPRSKNNSSGRGVRRTRGGQWRGKGRQAPQEFGIRQSILNASLPVVNARVRRIEYADARPPHLHLEFMRLGCSEFLIWVSPFMRLGCSECLQWFSPGLRQDFAKTLFEFGDGVWRWEGLRIAPRRVKIAPRRTKSRAQIAQGTPKSSPRASKTTNFEFFHAFFKNS